jgi:hypothetical protein
MILLNFAHPITTEQQVAIEALTGQKVERIVEVKTQFDAAQPFAEQAQHLIAAAGLTAMEWQTLPLLVNLPSLNVIAALLLAELHGRCGYFPAVLRLRPIVGSAPPQFKAAEIVNLQAVRDTARQKR